MGYGLAVIDDKTLRLDVVSYMDLNLLRLEVTCYSLHDVPTRATAYGGSADYSYDGAGAADDDDDDDDDDADDGVDGDDDDEDDADDDDDDN